MDLDHYTHYIRKHLSHIQYDTKNASRNAHYQLGLLIGIIAQAAARDNKIMNIVDNQLEENPYKKT